MSPLRQMLGKSEKLRTRGRISAGAKQCRKHNVQVKYQGNLLFHKIHRKNYFKKGFWYHQKPFLMLSETRIDRIAVIKIVNVFNDLLHVASMNVELTLFTVYGVVATGSAVCVEVEHRLGAVSLGE